MSEVVTMHRPWQHDWFKHTFLHSEILRDESKLKSIWYIYIQKCNKILF